MFNQLFSPHVKHKGFRTKPVKAQVGSVQGSTVTFSDEQSHIDPRLDWRSMTISAQIANDTIREGAPSVSIAPTLEQVTDAYNVFKSIHDRVTTEEEFNKLIASDVQPVVDSNNVSKPE